MRASRSCWREGGEDLQPDVGEGADGQRDLLSHQPFDQPVVFEATHAVIDPPRLARH